MLVVTLSFKSQTITITDTKAPTLTIPADASAECDDVPAVGSASATDNCSDATVTYEGEVRTNGNCPNNYTLTRTWKAVDACGNTTFRLQTITITDTKAPTLTIPADASAECNDVPAVGSASATDNCSDATVTYEGEVRTNGNCPNNYTLTRTWKAVDACGNTTTKSQVITVSDNTKPVLTVPADASAECDDVPAVGSASATDNCSDATVTYEGEVRTNGNCPNNYTLTRTWKAVDACGNTTFRSQTITITDTKAPTLTIPADASAECDDVPAVGSASATDNCSDATVTYEGEVRTNGNCPNNYTLTRTWKAVDACGNTTFRSQTITITDTKAPTLTIPADASAECDDVPAVGSASATDNCSDATVTYEGEVRTNGNCPNNYTLTRTWKAVDACGNTTFRSQTITITDTKAPTLTIPADASAECDDVPAVGSASATDNCSDATVTYEGEVRTNGNCPNNYTLTRTWKAVDACGNTTFRSQTITITDTKAPTLTIPADASAECNDVPAVGSASATDNCSDATVTYEGEVRTNGNCPNNYTLTRTWKAVDACGNTTTKSQVITVSDNTKPVLTVPADASAECDDVPAVGSASATDNCSDATVTYEGEVRTNGNCPNNYTLTRTWKAVDACGNTTFRSQTITITDTKAPTLTIPADASAECDDVPAVGSASATDNCSDATVTYEGEVRTNGNCPNNYTLTRTWKAVDACGNTTFRSQTITITDTKAPTLTIPADASAECDDVPAVGSASATDNCSDATVTYEGEVRTNGNCPNNYTLTRTWKAVDACGNTSFKSQTITITDTKAPTLTIPADASAECDDVPAVGSASATDNCSDATVTYEGEVRTNGNCPNNYTLTRTWKAVDACGNTTTKSQVITVSDNTKPVLTVPADASAECDDVPAVGSASATDNCSDATVTYEGEVRTNGNCPNNYTLTRTWKAVDACGNTRSDHKQ
jgi:hypothetical protein